MLNVTKDLVLYVVLYCPVLSELPVCVADTPESRCFLTKGLLYGTRRCVESYKMAPGSHNLTTKDSCRTSRSHVYLNKSSSVTLSAATMIGLFSLRSIADHFTAPFPPLQGIENKFLCSCKFGGDRGDTNFWAT